MMAGRMSTRSSRPDPYSLRTWFPVYRMVVYDGLAGRFRVVELEASDDTEAMALAREAAGGAAFELWDTLCLIGRYEPTG